MPPALDLDVGLDFVLCLFIRVAVVVVVECIETEAAPLARI